MEQDLIAVSRFLSLILRHQPQIIQMEPDAEGWLDIDQLIENSSKFARRKLSRGLIERVVKQSDKQRFAICCSGQRIRANQGHSLSSVQIEYQSIRPPEFLFHGTVKHSIEAILKSGLKRMSRNHVHLSGDQATARKVGSRRGTPIILIIRSAAMSDSGFDFYQAENGVWLTDRVPPEFIEVCD